MRNRLYGGVRGQVNTKGGEHLRLVFTSYSIYMVLESYFTSTLAHPSGVTTI